MANLTTLTRATACAGGRWSRRNKFSSWIAWAKDPDATVRRACFYKHPGAEMNPEDLELGTSPTFLMLVNELNCCVISYDTNPGGFYRGAAEEPDAKFFPDNRFDDAAAIGALRTMLSRPGNGILPSGMRITTDPHFSIHAGGSSGGFNAFKTQFARDGDFPYSLGPVARGEALYAREYGWHCDFLWGSQIQVTLSQECADPFPTATGWAVNGAHSAGATSINVTGGSGTYYKGNRLVFNSAGQAYAIEAAWPGSGAITIFPSLVTPLTGGETVDYADQALAKYGTFGWAGSYFYSGNSGYTWDTFPIGIKKQAGVDVMITADNPRTREVNVMLTGATGGSLYTSALTGERSFLSRWNPDAQDAALTSLHDEAPSFWLAHNLYLLGNTNVELYQGSSSTNVNPGDPSVPWNKGRNVNYSQSGTIGFPPQVFKTFLQARGW